MQTMCEVSVTTIYRAIIIKDIYNDLTRSLMICRDKEKSNTLLFNSSFLLQFTKGVNQNINTLITEFISSAVYHENAAFRYFIAKHSFSYTNKFFSCCLSPFFKNIICRNERILESVWCYKINFLT